MQEASSGAVELLVWMTSVLSDEAREIRLCD